MVSGSRSLVYPKTLGKMTDGFADPQTRGSCGEEEDVGFLFSQEDIEATQTVVVGKRSNEQVLFLNR